MLRGRGSQTADNTVEEGRKGERGNIMIRHLCLFQIPFLDKLGQPWAAQICVTVQGGTNPSSSLRLLQYYLD